MKIKPSDRSHDDFILLVRELDAELYERYGGIMEHYHQYNGIEHIRHAVVLSVDGVPAGWNF